MQKVEAEGGILIIKLLDLVVGDRQGFAVLNAFERSGAAIVRRQHRQFAHDLAWVQLDAELKQQIAAAYCTKHLMGLFALGEQDIALPEAATNHERLEPIHRGIAAS